jgi:aminoglycoside phosphotransferase (APT) family kinase protein
LTENPDAIVTPWRRTPEQLAEGLRTWARARRGEAAELSDVRSPGSGMANDTVLFTLDGEPLVARLAPAPDSPSPTFQRFDLELQEQVMGLVRDRTEVPVPEVVHHERDEGWLGAPFLVVRAVDGVVASDNPPYLLDPSGWFLQGTPELWRRFETSTIDVLVRLHTIEDDGISTAFLHPGTEGPTALARHLAAMCDYYEWGREGERVPVLERTIEVLTSTLPANERSVLNWGDSRPGNIIYRDFEPVAVLDWEMAGVGPPELDVAWCTFFQRFWAHSAAQHGASVVPMFDREETRSAYEQRSGRPLDDLAWYEAMAGLRFGTILMRMYRRSVAFGMAEAPAQADDLIMFAPLLHQILSEVTDG